MKAIASAELIAEAELVARSCSPERRLHMVQQIAGLFAAHAARFQPAQIRLFDDVLIPLVERLDAATLAKVSGMFAVLDPAPTQTIRRLAGHEENAVAAPILARSTVLCDDDLARIAGNLSQRHLLAMSGRRSLNERLTDIILKRAGKETARALARNCGAQFSEKGYSALLALAQRDDSLAESVGLRPDLPKPVRDELLSKASETVRARLLKAARGELQESIRATIEALAPQRNSRSDLPDDYSEALDMVEALNRTGKLNDSIVNRFAVRRELGNVVAALSVLSGGDVKVIEPLMETSDCEGLIIACRAARLNWQTTVSVINSRPAPKPTKELIEMGRQLFDMLSLSSAQYTIRFEPPTPAPARAALEACG